MEEEDRAVNAMKFSLHQKISNWESKLEQLNVPKDSPLWYWLAHARKEWSYHNFVQVMKDLNRMDLLLEVG